MHAHYDVEAYRRDAQARTKAMLDEMQSKATSPEALQWIEVQRLFTQLPIEAIATCMQAQNNGADLVSIARAAGIAAGNIVSSLQASFEQQSPQAMAAFADGFDRAANGTGGGVRTGVDVHPMKSGRA